MTLPIRSLALLLAISSHTYAAQDYKPEALTEGRVDPSLHLQQGMTQTEAEPVTDSIYRAAGFGNTFLVTTDAGSIVIDTSLEQMAPAHHKLLDKVSDAPIAAIILTHGHEDHTGGVALWRQAQTKVIAQENLVEFLHYQKRLEGAFLRRNRAQFGFDLTSDTDIADTVDNFAADIPANTLFDEEYTFSEGDTRFELLHTPGETYDALSVWMPQSKAVFTGDLFYRSFPNMYTLRGTKPRWALDYIASLNRIMALEPELLLPSHGEPIKGKEKIRATLTQYRDAIQYVHDQTVLGMNRGEDVYTLMNTIQLPPELDVGDGYGRVSWSVRGIYDGYLGWFDANPADMYAVAPATIQAELATLAGGPDAILPRCRQWMNAGKNAQALHLLNAALTAAPDHREALQLKLEILTRLRQESANLNESGWLNYDLQRTRALLGENER